MAGRNKEPLAVIQGKGKSNHLTKEEIKRRQEHEEKVKGFTDKIVPPSYLTAKQKKDFEEISSELIRLEIFSNLDVDALARYIDSRDMYIRLVKDLKKIKATEIATFEDGAKKVVANEDYPKLMKSKNLLFTECRAAASDLGLTITSRLKLVIPKKEDDKPKNKFSKFAR
ncbi:phage terminase small subunit P27 family [Sutcliffiella halmapala]|uniref:phage terminase small subunit P27 family n=1 Tax=Sutcliffiella halmapala TaxID=79882 RepID=UPI000994F7CB|nr:phage terminase small subunit P27 family [Sutcliffiella halmapala]